jgi:hypothetical protein
VRELALLDKPKAASYLARKGFTIEEQTLVLNTTHCNPPENYFITSNDMVGKAGVWAHFGLWNFTKSYAVGKSRTLPQAEAVDDLMKRFGMTEKEATDMYFEVKSLTSEGAINQYVAPWPGYITSNWVACRTAANSSAMVCPLGMQIGQQGTVVTVIESITYNISRPNASRITYGFYQNGQRVGTNGDGIPARMLVATNTSLTEVKFNDTTHGLAVLMDMSNQRMLVADPLLISSVFTQLYYLDGRFMPNFEKFDERSSMTGSRVVVWKVNWDMDAKDVTNATRVR